MLSELRRILSRAKGAPRKRKVIAAAHLAMWPAMLLPRVFWPRRKRIEPLPESGRILLVRIDGIGDLAMSAAIFPVLRRRYPAARIDLLTSNVARPVADLLMAEGWIDAVRTMPLVGRRWSDYAAAARTIRSERYDVAVDLRGDFRTVVLLWLGGVPHRLGLAGSGMRYLLTEVVDLPPRTHQSQEVAALAERLGVPGVPAAPALPLQPTDRESADAWLAEQGVSPDRRLCVFHIGAFKRTRVWPLERFTSLARQLRESLDATIVIVGGKDEAADAAALAASLGDSVVAAAGRTSLIQSAAIAARACVFVGNDSGPAHVAAGVGCPSVVLFFGLADPQRIRPVGRSVTILQPGRRCDVRCTEEACACPETRCMLDHTVDRVAAAAEAAARASANYADS